MIRLIPSGIERPRKLPFQQFYFKKSKIFHTARFSWMEATLNMENPLGLHDRICHSSTPSVDIVPGLFYGILFRTSFT
ncbi:MAG: hypothetical protein QGE94_05040 [Desulfobacterales bacterium]|nr:hypothetical protein [Desulfobacterales bacterium]